MNSLLHPQSGFVTGSPTTADDKALSYSQAGVYFVFPGHSPFSLTSLIKKAYVFPFLLPQDTESNANPRSWRILMQEECFKTVCALKHS